MSFFRKKKSRAPKNEIKSGHFDQEIIDLMEKLNIPKSGRDGVLKLPEAQKKIMLEQYKAKLTKPKVSGKEWSDKFNDPKVDPKVLKQFEVITKDSDSTFAEEFIQELGLKRLCRVSIANTGAIFDQQILLIFKAIIDTSQNIIKAIVNDDLIIKTIANKMDSEDHKVRELCIKLLVTLIVVEDDELSWVASSKIMEALLESARMRGYRNRWKSVISHLSVNELSGTGSFEYDNYALMLINFIITGLETLEERTDERRLLNSLKFNESLENLSVEIEDTLRGMDSTNTLSLSRASSGKPEVSISSSESSEPSTSMKVPVMVKKVSSMRPRRLSGHSGQLQQYHYCMSVVTQITAYNNLREEDLNELREEGVLDDENDLSSPMGLFKVVHDQALDDGYINELTSILKNLITIPASGDIIWENINKIVQSACAPTQNKHVNTTDKKTYLSFKELQHLLKVQADDEEKKKEIEAKHNETEQKLNHERKKVNDLEKQVQDLQHKLNQQTQDVQKQTEEFQKQTQELQRQMAQIQTLQNKCDQIQTQSAVPATWSGGGLPPPSATPISDPGQGLPPINTGGLGGLPPPSYDTPTENSGGLPPPAPIPIGNDLTQSTSQPTPPVDVYSTYRRMMKMSIPKRAILNKMKQAGIAIDILQKYELTGKLPPAPSQPIAAPSPAPVPTTAVVPDGLDKYRKMIKMKIPQRAIANKMKQAGIKKDIIQKYELTGELPSGGALPPPAPVPAAVPDDGLSKEEEIKLAKYTRMKKMKLPEVSIRNRMIQDGIDKSLIEKFFGASKGGSATSIAAPKVKAKPKWPEHLKKKTEIKPGRKMKNLQWTTVDPFIVEKSIWSEVDDSKIKFDAKDLESMFGQKIIARKAPKTAGRKKKEMVEHIHILDGKRSYNIEIFLGRLKMDPFAVKDALLSMDEVKFNAEQVAKLQNFVPTTEEATLFDDLETNDLKNLAKPEKFFYTIKNIDKNLPQRLQLWAFKMNFDKVLQMESDKVNALCEAHRCIKTSKSLRQLFSTILAFGNHMNGGTRKGQAHGFKLKSLGQLTRSRSTDNKVTLMEYLYLYLSKTNIELLKFTEEWKPLEAAISVDVPTLKSGIAQIGSKLNIINNRCKAADTNSIAGDKFAGIMKPFHSTASTEFEDLKKKNEVIMKDMYDLALFLNEKNDRSGQFLKTLNEFRKQFMFTAKQCEERRKREEQKKKREQWKLNKKKANKQNSTHKAQVPSGGLPPPVFEDECIDDMKELNVPKKGGLPPPPPPTPNNASSKMFSSNPTQADQLLAALMRSDSTVLMKKLKSRRKKNSIHNRTDQLLVKRF